MSATKLDKIEVAFGPFLELLEQFNGNCRATADYINDELPTLNVSERTIRRYRDRWFHFRPREERTVGEAIKGPDSWLYNAMLRDLKKIRSVTKILPLKHKVTPATEDLAIVLSDLHFGKRYEQGGKVVFDLDIARQNLGKLIDNARHLTDTYIRPMHKLDALNIFIVGDIIDGELVYASQTYNLEMPVREQVRVALESLMPLVRWGADTFNAVRIFTAYGNHGAGDDRAHQTSNWDLILYDMLELATAEMDKVEVNVSPDTYNLAVVRGHKYLLRHKIHSQLQTAAGGRQVGGWWNIHQFDMLITGHWHNPRLDNFNGIPVLYNGNLFLTDEYTEQLSFNGWPTQFMFGISNKRVMTWMWPVRLE